MYYRNSNIFLSNNELKDTIRYDNIDYLISHLSGSNKGSKGGNSNVFKLINPQTEEEFVIKFSKYNINNSRNSPNIIKRISRFEREIEALKLSDDLNSENVIRYFFDDSKDIKSK